MINKGMVLKAPQKAKRINFASKIKEANIYELLEYLIVFLLSRVSLFASISPFGTAYFAATFPKQKMVFGIVFSCLGIALSGFNILSLKYIASLVIIAAFSILMKRELENRKLITALIASISLILTGMVFVIFNGFLLYDIMQLLLEAIITFLSYFAFDKASELIPTIRERKVFEQEETISLVVLFAAIILSISSYVPLRGLAHILSVTIIMMLSLSGGFAVSATSAVVLGFVNGVSDVLPAQVLGVYAICGIVSGLFRKYGKWGVSVSFLITDIIVNIYFNRGFDFAIPYYYVIVSAAILFAVPKSWYAIFGQVIKLPNASAEAEPIERAKEILTNRLENVKASFNDLSGIFEDIIEDKINIDIKDVNLIFDKTADNVCKACTMCRNCWQRNYNETTHILMNMFEFMQERGYAIDIDAPKHFREGCIKFKDFMDELNKNYEVYKINMLWSGKVMESRGLVAEQFRNISSMLDNVRKQLDTDIDIDIILENKLRASLDKKGIYAENLTVKNLDGYEVLMDVGEEYSDKISEIAGVLSEALKVPMLRAGKKSFDEIYTLRFMEQARFSVNVGFAKVARDGQVKSGDSHGFMLTDDGKYVLAVSDGMGSGSKASIQSAITIELIKRLLGAGFDKETAVKLINSVLMVNLDKETFATVDMCLVNLYSGSLEFIKIGASASFIKSLGGVEVIKSASLPAGIITHIDVDCELKYAKNSDYIIMVTDGVSDVFEEGELDKVIAEYRGNSPQRLADNIITEAIARSVNCIKDDMTVLAARLTEDV